jgi:hypothetical protein
MDLVLKSVQAGDFSSAFDNEEFVSALNAVMELNTDLQKSISGDGFLYKASKMLFSIIQTNLSTLSSFLSLLEQAVNDENDKIKYCDIMAFISGMHVKLRYFYIVFISVGS